MKILNAFLVMLLAAPAASPALAVGDEEGVSPRIDDRMMVRVAQGATLDQFLLDFHAMHAPAVTLDPLEMIPGRPIHLLHVDADPGVDLDAIELSLEQNFLPQPLVWAEFLYENEVPEGHTGSIFVDGFSDVDFSSQYAGDLIDLDGAHAQSTGLGVVVAVLDTGVDATHPELEGRVMAGGWDFIDGDADPAEASAGAMVGHGTFVAGIIAFTAPDASILPVRVLDADGVGDGWILARAIYFAVDQGAHVINLSLGSTYDTEAAEDAIDDARSRGVVVVAAAGNLDREEPEEFPAMKSDPIGVAATGDTDLKAGFSNFHDKIAISAPGATVFTAPGQPDPDRAVVGIVPGGGYAIWEGTSMSTPFVSGTAALVRARCVEWPECLSTAEEITNLLLITADDIYQIPGNQAYDEQLGSGRLNAAAAVAITPACNPGCPTPLCPADVNGDGRVDVVDLTQIILNYGPCAGCVFDIDGDGAVAVTDLVEVITNWGPC